MHLTQKQKDAAKARYKREGGIGKNRTKKAKARGKTRSTGRGSSSKAVGKMPGNRKTSFCTVIVGTSVGIEAASLLGYEQAREIENVAMEMAAKVGIATGLGLLGTALALKAAGSPIAAKIPLAGGAIHLVGMQWRSFLADFNLRP